MIPGAGADIAAFVAYNETRRFSKTPENFGRVKLKLWPPVRQARMAAPVAHCYLC